MSVKKKLGTAALAIALISGSVLGTAAPAMAASTVYTKSFYDWGACVGFYFSPPAGIHPDFWWGCKLVGAGLWTVKYTKD